MDGPFFSLMPFPLNDFHSLSHVRYTPHSSSTINNPKKVINKLSKSSRVKRMIRDSKRYFPLIEYSNYVKSIYEIKTVSIDNEDDDGRPIIFERDNTNPRMFTILGGKIDNIYDVFEKLNEELLRK